MEDLEQALRQQREEHLQSLQELQSLLASGEADPDLVKVCSCPVAVASVAHMLNREQLQVHSELTAALQETEHALADLAPDGAPGE